MTIEELVGWYQQMINIHSWINNYQFVNVAVVGVRCFVEEKLCGNEEVKEKWMSMKIQSCCGMKMAHGALKAEITTRPRDIDPSS